MTKDPQKIPARLIREIHSRKVCQARVPLVLTGPLCFYSIPLDATPSRRQKRPGNDRTKDLEARNGQRNREKGIPVSFVTQTVPGTQRESVYMSAADIWTSLDTPDIRGFIE